MKTIISSDDDAHYLSYCDQVFPINEVLFDDSVSIDKKMTAIDTLTSIWSANLLQWKDGLDYSIIVYCELMEFHWRFYQSLASPVADEFMRLSLRALKWIESLGLWIPDTTRDVTDIVKCQSENRYRGIVRTALNYCQIDFLSIMALSVLGEDPVDDLAGRWLMECLERQETRWIPCLAFENRENWIELVQGRYEAYASQLMHAARPFPKQSLVEWDQIPEAWIETDWLHT